MTPPLRVLFDFNNLAIMNLHLPIVQAKTPTPKWELWDYLMFTRIHDFVIKAMVDTKSKKVEVYLAGDLKAPNWRNEVYKPYKADRAPSPDIDWDTVWAHLEAFKETLQEFMPWHQITVKGAEADDIIAILTKQQEANNGLTTIYSSDSDYLQLCSPNTRVFKPTIMDYVAFPATLRIAGTKVECPTREEFTLLSVLTGQGGKDNVYNVRTPEDWAPAPDKKRKPPYGVKAAHKAIHAPEGMQSHLTKLGHYERYLRNKELIDFECIPESVEQAILEVQSTLPPLNNSFKGYTEKASWGDKHPDKEGMDELYKEIFKHANHNTCTA